MPFRHRLRLMLPPLLVVLVSLCLPAAALTLAAASWNDMLQMADRVVSARVASVQAEATSEPGAHGICTRVRLTDVSVLSGKAERTSIDLILPGGTLGHRQLRVPGAPAFVAGETAVLFLRTADEPGAYHLCGYGMGVLRVRNDGVVIPDLPVENGPPSSGETLNDFLQRFPLASGTAVPPAAVTTPAHSQFVGWSGLAVLSALLLALGIVLRRRRRSPLIAVILGALLSALLPAPRILADAASRAPFNYTLEGSHWDLNAPLIDRISAGRILWFQGKTTKDLSAAAAFGTIAASFQQWEDVPASAVAFRMAGLSVDAGSADDQRNVVSFLIKPPRSGFDTRTLALTYLLGDASGTTFTDTDTVFNDKDITWVVSGARYSLDVVSLHEIGHVIGLGHSTSLSDAMYPVAQGVNVLSDSDKAGAVVLYPLNTVVPITSAYACPRLGAAPLSVAFSSDGTTAGTGVPLTVQWDFGDGTPVSSELNPTHVYTAPGTYTARLTIPGVPLAPPSLTLIRVNAPTGSPTLKKFQYQVSLLAAARGRDTVSATVDGVNFTSGDTLIVMVGGVALSSQSVAGGTLATNFNPAKRELKLQLNGAALGRTFDFRDRSSTAKAGIVTLPFDLLVTHADQSVTLYDTTVTFNFTVKTGRTATGIVEKSIQAKKR